MKKQSKRALMIGASIVFVLFFIIVVARPLQTEFRFENDWVLPVGTAAVGTSVSPGAALLNFRLGNKMGYFTPEGRLVRLIDVPYKGVISASYYAVFSETAVDIPVYTPDGAQAALIRGAGFPHIDSDRLFLFHPGGNSFSSIASDGEAAWFWEGFSPILAFDSSPGGTVAGFADGSLVHFGPSGAATKIVPGGSTYPVALGAAVSADGSLVASVTGLQRQRFVLTEITAAAGAPANRVLYHNYLKRDSNGSAYVFFTADNTCVFYAQEGTLTAVNLKTLRPTEIAVTGTVITMIEAPEAAVTFALTVDSSGGPVRSYRVYTIEANAHLVGSFVFTASHACIRAEGTSLYVGKDDLIAKMTITRK